MTNINANHQLELLQAIGYTRALVLGLDQPSAVPLVLNASQQAKLETDAIDRSS